MDFEIPNRSNWKKRHKLVGIGLISTSLILTLLHVTSMDDRYCDSAVVLTV
jgi:hypothetical protein